MTTFTFRPMRRKRQLLSQEECVEILNRTTYGTLALLGDGGYPYSLPISYVYSDDKLFFHSALKGHKIDASDRVSQRLRSLWLIRTTLNQRNTQLISGL